MRYLLAFIWVCGVLVSTLGQESKTKALHSDWIELKDVSQVEAILARNTDAPIILFKHSTACSVSAKAFDHLKSNYKLTKRPVLFYYLDLLSHRDVSNWIEQKTGVKHHSPQVIVWHNGKVLYTATHQEINWKEIHRVIHSSR
jgi:bacillithiol system protein YtxJ